VQQKTQVVEDSKSAMTWDMKQAARNQIFSPEAGPGAHCWPRHRLPFNSRNKGS